jgi:hypothetical protein
MSDIFESPNGGKTVYRRLPGTSQRELYSDIVSDGRTLHEQLQENQMWVEIRRMARQDAVLRDLLERAIVYYNLKKDHGNKENL